METISFNQLYAGLFLKYNPISRIDFFTAIKDFEKTTNNVVDNVYSLSNIPNVSKYLKYLKNDTVALKDEYESIDQYLNDEKCLLPSALGAGDPHSYAFPSHSCGGFYGRIKA